MKITQLRDKEETTALTTMDIETWIEKQKLKSRHDRLPFSEKCSSIPYPMNAATEQTSYPRFYPPPISAGQKGGNK